MTAALAVTVRARDVNPKNIRALETGHNTYITLIQLGARWLQLSCTKYEQIWNLQDSHVLVFEKKLAHIRLGLGSPNFAVLLVTWVVSNLPDMTVTENAAVWGF